MRNSVFETAIGAIVIVVAGAFLFFALSSTDSSGGRGEYQLSARFNDVTGIESGSDVLLAGVKVAAYLMWKSILKRSKRVSFCLCRMVLNFRMIQMRV